MGPGRQTEMACKRFLNWLTIKGGRHMKEIVIMLAVVGVWFLLQAYILPKLGIST
jgi:hypothetical protein